MPIWIGDWMNGRKQPEKDRIVLYWGMWPGNDGTKPLAQKVQDDGHIDGPPRTWEGDMPPEHPDDVATDRRILDTLDNGPLYRLLRTTLPDETP